MAVFPRDVSSKCGENSKSDKLSVSNRQLRETRFFTSVAAASNVNLDETTCLVPVV